MATPSRRRWYQFSLATMFVVVTIMALGLGWLMQARERARHETLVARQLSERGMFVHQFFVPGRLLSRAFSVRVGPSPEFKDVSPLTELTSLQVLSLRGTSVEDLTPLAKLTGLSRLDVTNTPVKRDQLRALQKALPNCLIKHDPLP